MKKISKLKLMEFSVKIGITYVLDRKVLTITYRHLILILVRNLRIEVIGRGYVI